VWSRKPVWYDFANLNYRADVFFVGGNSDPLITLFNFSSFWAPNGTLYMITWADPRSFLVRRGARAGGREQQHYGGAIARISSSRPISPS
jgi:hypothetical protein